MIRVRAGLVALALFVGAAVPGRAAAQEPQRVVRGLEFEGNESLAKPLLAASIATTVSSWFARAWPVAFLGLGEKRYFNETDFQRDVLRLEILYKRSGFPDVEVDTTVRRTPEDVWVTFRITEGEPVRVTKLDFTGLDSLDVETREDVLVDLPLVPGDVFNRYVLQSTIDTVNSRLRNRGYPSADIFREFVSDSATRTAQITLNVVPGTRARFGTVRVEGARRVDSVTVTRLLSARRGRLYAEKDLLESQRTLYQSDLFRFATITVDSAEFEPNDATVPLVVRVDEARRRRIRMGIGYGTTDCFRGSLGWTRRNFLGSGRILELSSGVSKVGVGRPADWGLGDGICSASRDDSVGSRRLNYSLGASLRRPAFLSPQNALTVSVFAERRSEYKVFQREDVGASVGLTRQTPRRRLPLSLTYTLSYGRTEATAVNFCASFNACTPQTIDLLRQRRVLGTLTGFASVPNVNNPLDPTRGYQLSLEATHSSRVTGSSRLQSFTRVVSEAAWYRPVGRDVVLSWRVRGGMIFAPRTSDVPGEIVSFVPPEQRFYGGGPNDVRGFQRNELGPVVYVTTQSAIDRFGLDELPEDSVRVAATGGNTLAVGNVELRFPSPVFGDRVRLAAFVDVGGVWQRGAGEDSPSVIRTTPGMGLRVATPLGPARLDVAYNPYSLQRGALFSSQTDGSLARQDGDYFLDRDRRFTFHFSVGQPF